MKAVLHHWLFASTFLLLAGAAFAGPPIPVTNTHDSGSGSLRQAILDAGSGDTIIFDSGVTGAIVLTSGELEISRNLTILGPGPTNLTINPADFNSFRVFNILSNTPMPTVIISGLQIAGGTAQGTSADGITATNGAPGQGGGILNAANLTLTNCIISGNTAVGGTGTNDTSPLGNGGDGLGGGIFSQGLLEMTSCTISGNYATGGDAGFSYLGSGNGGQGSGAGVYLTGAGGSFVNCTIASNSATGGYDYGAGSGAGIYVAGTNVTVICCTISGNNSAGGTGSIGGAGAVSGGGIYVDGSATPTLGDTIVAGNVLAPNNDPNDLPVGPDVDGTVTSLGFNLIGRTDGNGGWVGSDQLGGTTDGTRLDPQLGPLQNNGGQTPTMWLGSTSAAIDAGTNFGINTDQRGYPRPFDWANVDNAPGSDGSDIGAYELFPNKKHLTISNPAPSTSGTLTLTPGAVYVLWINDSPGTTAQVMRPAFLLQTISTLTSSNMSLTNLPSGSSWSAFKGHVKLINGNWVARDPILPGSAFYGLVNLTNNSAYTNQAYPPDITLLASNIMTTSATLTGSVIPSETNTVYWFEYGTDPNHYGGMTQPTPLDTSDNKVIVTCSVVGLSPSTLCHFQLVVTNDWSIDTGPELGGDQQFATLDPVPLVSTQPASSITTNSALLNGIIDPEGPGVDNAYFEYGLDTNEQDLTQSTLFFPSGNYVHDFSYNATGLTPGTIYYYRFAAYNNTQAAYGTFLTCTTAVVVVQQTSPPTATTDPATNVGLISGYIYSAQFNAMVNPNGVNTMVYFQYGVSPGSLNSTTPTYDIGSGTTQTSYNFTVNTLNQLTSSTYYFQIVATNSIGATNGGVLSVTLP